MSRPKTPDTPDLSPLLLPQDSLMLAVEQAVLRNSNSAPVAASLPEQIAAKLAGVITLDLLHAGQRLLEQDISAVLNVSRAPVREALRILERDRLIEFQPRRGALVTEPDAAELRDIFFVRSTLFSVLLKNLMDERPADLEKVFAAHVPTLRAASEQSINDYVVATFLLNYAIADLASNRLLVDMLKSISLRTLRYVRLGLAANPSAAPHMVETWEALHEAVADRDDDRVIEIASGRITEIRDLSVRALEAHRASVASGPTTS
ncbi:GntR family transcriptional regulator [Rhodococcus wratislaviensis]|uniref:GntR family transcriptional regulator n=1 Tax=Rhodococcus wratislaviensis TaxID=44752 RepID=A0AB38F790_RHOWR|nr:GntR family transcriptional regulator [Rhodococcus wratislaviensis]REE77480.1 GntR family transcriptional regulator [Rhodococcus wratislaviensis]SPZ35425.1 GntR family transcriptional regulator [Rhodococcus wratislaviensis]